MADPITAVGIAVTAGGAIFKGMSQGAMYGYQANIARMNAQIAQQNAAYEVNLGEVQAQQQGMKTKSIIGQTKAVQGASGLDLNSGSAMEVRASEAELGAADQATIRSNAARRAYGFQVEAAQDEAQASLYDKASTNAEIGGFIDAGTSILGGGGSLSSRWLKANQIGLDPRQGSLY
jgi:hypothetical protein